MQFFIAGDPVPQGSKVPGVTKAGKPYLRDQETARLKAWRAIVERETRARMSAPVVGAVQVRLTFYLQKPKSTKYPDYPAGTPDLDKLVRAVFDGLKTGGAYEDDARVVRMLVDKEWTTLAPGCRVEVRPR